MYVPPFIIAFSLCLVLNSYFIYQKHNTNIVYTDNLYPRVESRV
jgi:hypothetical protein